MLQRYFAKEWAEKFMLQLMVDDLDERWGHIEHIDLAAIFNVAAPTRARDAIMEASECVRYGPAGVLWQAAELAPEVWYDTTLRFLVQSLRLNWRSG